MAPERPPASLTTLPPELLLSILVHLPTQSLLTFGQTSKKNHGFSVAALHTLRLAIFPKRVHALIAFLDNWGSPAKAVASSAPSAPHHHVPIILPPPPANSKPRQRRRRPTSASGPASSSNSSSSPASISIIANTTDLSLSPQSSARPASPRTSTGNPKPAATSASTTPQITNAQNAHLSSILQTYGPSLRDLEFLAFDLTPDGAIALSTHLSTCRRLALRFSHPHIRHRDIDRRYWDDPPQCSTAWNWLGGMEIEIDGDKLTERAAKGIVLNGLETLILERAGCTEWQLQRIVEGNPKLRELKMRRCNGVGEDFLQWLGGEWTSRKRLEALWIEECEGVDGESEDALEWIGGLAGLKSLSLRHCSHVNSELLETLNGRKWHIPDLFLPFSPGSPSPINFDDVLEVDPAYK